MEPKFSDELDKLIITRSAVHFCWVFMTGFMLAMLTLALGHSAFLMFNILLFSTILGGITMDITQIYFYRKGI